MRNGYQLFIFLFVILLPGLSLFAQGKKSQPLTGVTVNSLTGDFTRVYESTETTDSVSGKFYYTSPNQIFFEINYPLHQIMRIVDNLTEIYYPESKVGFILESTNPVVLPLIPGLMSAIRPDYGLSVLGFKLEDQKMEGDTLLTFWVHSKFPEKVGRFTVAQAHDRLIYTFYEAPDSVSYTKTVFSDYIPSSEDIFFPGKIFTKIRGKTTLSYEKIFLNNLMVNAKIPDEIVHFRIPEDAKIERRKW